MVIPWETKLNKGDCVVMQKEYYIYLTTNLINGKNIQVSIMAF